MDVEGIRREKVFKRKMDEIEGIAGEVMRLLVRD